MLRFKFRSCVVGNMRLFMPLLAAAALVLSTAAAQADLGDQLFKLLPDDGAELDLFGRSVAISGPTAIVGAWFDDDNGSKSGSAYLFDAASAPPCPWDLNGDREVGPFDLALVLGFWVPNPGHPSDLDGDGEVGPFDLALVLGNWGPCE